MIIPERIKKGDCIGIIAPSAPVIGDKVEEIKKAKEIIESYGFKVKFSKNLFSNTHGYSATAKEKAEDINDMFLDKEVKMIWCATGGSNSNSTFEYINFELIKQNPKIICGYSDITSLINVIHEEAGLVTFSGMNFKSVLKDEDKFSYNEVIKRLSEGSLDIGCPNGENEYKTIKEGIAEGELVGGNLFLTRGMTEGKYKINFKDKILFIEELGFETQPDLIHNMLYYMKQNGVFEQIKGLWLGNYENEMGYTLEQIVVDVLGNEYNFPIIKSNNFGHINKQTVIPIGTKARINTNNINKIELIEECVK